MSRREFLGWAGAAALAACANRSSLRGAEPIRAGVRAVAFDLFTLFDPRGVERRVLEVLGPEHERLAAVWKTKLFEYSWLRAASGQYRDFEGLVSDTLTYAARAQGVVISDAARGRLESAFTELDAWPDSAQTLDVLRERQLRLAPLANFAPRMIERLLDRARLKDRFEVLISTDRAHTYKPDPRAYALAESVLGLARSQIAFAAFGAWDAAGARWFGFPTFWVNRLSQTSEQLVTIDASGPDLGGLAQWLQTVT